MSEETSLKDEIKELKDSFNRVSEGKVTKQFKIPWRARVSKKKIADGFITVLYVSENKGAKFLRTKVKEGTIMIDGAPHIATPNYMLNYKNKPLLVAFSWNTHPLSVEQNLSVAEIEKRTTIGYRLLLNRLKEGEIKQKKTISIGIILGVIALLIGGYYLLSQGGFI